MSRAANETQPVDPARLAAGRWCHRTNKDIGKGDIYGSYSADCIGMGKPVRKPFTWKGVLHACTGIRHNREAIAVEAYRLVHPNMFPGEPTTYAAKLRDADAARADPEGFYHGMTVTHAGTALVLCGPPVLFVPGKSEQLSLF